MAEMMSNSHWNYRVVRHINGRQGGWWGLHEIHYENNQPIMLTEKASGIVGNDRDDIRAELATAERARTTEVLVFDDKTELFIGEEESLTVQAPDDMEEK